MSPSIFHDARKPYVRCYPSQRKLGTDCSRKDETVICITADITVFHSTVVELQNTFPRFLNVILPNEGKRGTVHLKDKSKKSYLF